MKVEDYKSSDIEGSDFEGYDAGIDESNTGFMFDIVSKQMYKRPIQSIIREITSNCFDSHVEAKVDDPVVIILKSDEGGDFITFKDVGVGMSPERMRKIYSRYFSSTKRGTNDQIGMFGLGSKSPLSYTDLFYLTTFYDGKKYEYQIHTGQSKPRIDLLIEDDTTERNGTEVKIYMKNYSDMLSFVAACRSELAYFDNVFIDSYHIFDNNYTILEYKTFKFRTDAKYSNELHLIIGKVPYPISWHELGIDRIPIPVGLKFEIGDLQVTPAREDIRYVDIKKSDGSFVSAKSVILAKIDEFIAEINTLYETKTDYIFEDYEEYKRYKKQEKTFLTIDEGVFLDISSLVKKPEPIFSPLKDFVGKLPDNIFFEYVTSFKYNKTTKNRSYEQTVTFDALRDTLHLVPSKSGKLAIKKMHYLYEYAFSLTSKYEYIFADIRENEYGKISIKEKLRSICKYLHISYNDYTSTHTDQHREGDGLKRVKVYKDLSITNATKQLKMFRDFAASEFKRLSFSVDQIEIDQEWLREYNLAHKIRVAKEDNSFLAYNYGYSAKVPEKEYITTATLDKFTGFILYGFPEDEELLKNFKALLVNSKYGDGKMIYQKICRIYQIAKRSEKLLLGLSNKNACHVYDFMGNNKVFKRFATAAMIEDESKAIRLRGYGAGTTMIHKDDNFSTLMEEIFPPVADALKELRKEVDEFNGASYTRVDNKTSKAFFNELISVAKEYSLYDKEMYEVHQKLERYVGGLDLINYIACVDKVLPHLVDFLLLKGKRIDAIWTNSTDEEKQLARESSEKLEYLLSIYTATNYRNERHSYRQNDYPFLRFGGLSTTQIEKEKEKLNKLKISYNALIKFQEYGKQTNN